MAIALDVLTRIINVQWGGVGVFVSGDFCCFAVRYTVAAKSGTSDILAESLGMLDFGEDGQIFGSSYHNAGVDTAGKNGRPVFLLCGLRGIYPSGTGRHANEGIIMASEDGKNWRTVYVLERKLNDNMHDTYSEVDGVVWDPRNNAFFAGGHQEVMTFAFNSDGNSYLQYWEETDVLMTSKDGFSWSIASSLDFKIFTSDGEGHDENHGDPPWPKSLLSPYCSTRHQDASYGNNVPDGVYHYGKVSGKTVHIYADAMPAIDHKYGGTEWLSSSIPTFITIDVTESDGTSKTLVSSPGIPWYVVAYVEGTILAVGGPRGGSVANIPVQYAVSFDMGKTWKTGSVGPAYAPTITVIGGSLKGSK